MFDGHHNYRQKISRWFCPSLPVVRATGNIPNDLFRESCRPDLCQTEMLVNWTMHIFEVFVFFSYLLPHSRWHMTSGTGCIEEVKVHLPFGRRRGVSLNAPHILVCELYSDWGWEWRKKLETIKRVISRKQNVEGMRENLRSGWFIFDVEVLGLCCWWKHIRQECKKWDSTTEMITEMEGILAASRLHAWQHGIPTATFSEFSAYGIWF